MYQTSEHYIYRVSDGAVIPKDPSNSDYKEFIRWMEEGNEPAEHEPSQQTASAEQNKIEASRLLQQTDWATLPDVNFVNRQEFLDYRAVVRGHVINPVAGFINWPAVPKAVWE